MTETTPDSDEPDQAQPPSTVQSERLWTPWRMRYVAGGTREAGCIFCNRLEAGDDVAALILHRGERAFAIMNLFPYNTGHVMVVPYAHLASPEDADRETLAEMTALRVHLLRALRRVLGPDGFNIGLNVGAVAGAGVADHFHEHVVPRWQGDANFMPILAATTVMPELIPVTYAKLRAELGIEQHQASQVRVAAVSHAGTSILVDADGQLPSIAAAEGEPLWRTALRAVERHGVPDAEIVGWAEDLSGTKQSGALVLRGTLPAAATTKGSVGSVAVVDLPPGPTANLARAAVARYARSEQPIGPG